VSPDDAGRMNAIRNPAGAGYEYRNVFNWRTSRYAVQYVPK